MHSNIRKITTYIQEIQKTMQEYFVKLCKYTWKTGWNGLYSNENTERKK